MCPRTVCIKGCRHHCAVISDQPEPRCVMIRAKWLVSRVACLMNQELHCLRSQTPICLGGVRRGRNATEGQQVRSVWGTTRQQTPIPTHHSALSTSHHTHLSTLRVHSVISTAHDDKIVLFPSCRDSPCSSHRD
jgi:hypothetical protein